MPIWLRTRPARISACSSPCEADDLFPRLGFPMGDRVLIASLKAVPFCSPIPCVSSAHPTLPPWLLLTKNSVLPSFATSATTSSRRSPSPPPLLLLLNPSPLVMLSNAFTFQMLSRALTLAIAPRFRATALLVMPLNRAASQGLIGQAPVLAPTLLLSLLGIPSCPLRFARRPSINLCRPPNRPPSLSNRLPG